MKFSLVVRNLILMIYVQILMDPTFDKIADMLLGERYAHHLDLIGSMIILYVVVEIDIRVIVEMPPSPIIQI